MVHGLEGTLIRVPSDKVSDYDDCSVRFYTTHFVVTDITQSIVDAKLLPSRGDRTPKSYLTGVHHRLRLWCPFLTDAGPVRGSVEID